MGTLGAFPWLLNNQRGKKKSVTQTIPAWKQGGDVLSPVRNIQQQEALIEAISRGDVGWEAQLHQVPDGQTLVLFPHLLDPQR